MWHSQHRSREDRACLCQSLPTPSIFPGCPTQRMVLQTGAGLPTNAIKIILYWAGFLPTSSSAKLINTIMPRGTAQQFPEDGSAPSPSLVVGGDSVDTLLLVLTLKGLSPADHDSPTSPSPSVTAPASGSSLLR